MEMSHVEYTDVIARKRALYSSNSASACQFFSSYSSGTRQSFLHLFRALIDLLEWQKFRKGRLQWRFSRSFSSFQAMSTSAAVALELLPVQMASKANGTVVLGSSCLEFVPGKHQAKPRFMQDLSRIKPQMMQKVLSSIGLSEDKKSDFANVNPQVGGFNGRSKTSEAEIIKLFPVNTGFDPKSTVTEKALNLSVAIDQTDPDSSGSVPVKAPEQQSTDRLTIFYNGAVIVYDVPAEKAEAIMRLADANSLSNTKTSTMTSSKIDQILKPLPSEPALNAVDDNQPQRSPVGLEFVRKLSLQHFLQKRKERMNGVAPYTTMKTAILPSKEENSDDQITLSLA